MNTIYLRIVSRYIFAAYESEKWKPLTSTKKQSWEFAVPMLMEAIYSKYSVRNTVLL